MNRFASAESLALSPRLDEDLRTRLRRLVSRRSTALVGLATLVDLAILVGFAALVTFAALVGLATFDAESALAGALGNPVGLAFGLPERAWGRFTKLLL